MRHQAFPKPQFPTVPGIYIWRRGDDILYIGKAKHLARRLTSYYRKNHDDPKTRVLMAQVQTVEWVEVDTEEEALLLEEELIKRYRPPYNIRLKDDKRFPYVAITDDEYPRVVVRQRADVRTWRYYGPYGDKRSLRTSIAAINKLYLYPLWGDNWQHRGNPPVSKQVWKQEVSKIEKILQGRLSPKDDVAKKIQEAVKELRFEYAGNLRDWGQEISYLQPKRILNEQNSYDVLGWAENEEGANLQVLQLRGDRLVGRRSYTTSVGDFAAAILEAYRLEPAPSTVYVATLPPEHKLISQALGKPIVVATRETLRYVRMAEKNAVNTLQYVQEHERVTDPQNGLNELAALLKINVPHRIECYDISNLGATHPVAAMAVMIDGLPEHSEYRRWSMEASGQNDYQMLAWTLRRRLSAIGGKDKSLSTAPDLIVIDGGKGQLSVANAVIRKYKIPVISLAKRLEEVFVPGESDPLLLPASQPANLMLQRLRDETHKTAIEFHRSKRRNAALSEDILADVKGLGEKRKNALLDHFGSMDAVLVASQPELEKVLGIKVAQSIYKQLHR